MIRRRAFRPQRIRIFVGCEGESELGYTIFLHNLLNEHRQDRHLDGVVLKGGDPLSRAQRALEEVQRREAARDRYSLKFLLLDSDRRGHDVERDQEFDHLIQEGDMRVVWQRPCFEAVLLRHFPGCQDRQPRTQRDALAALVAEWAGYDKPMTALQLRAKLQMEDVRNAAAVEPDLASFLREIGLF